MAKGISIHVGVNEVSSTVFSAPKLNHCEDDANAMFELAKAAGFTPAEPLLGEKATFANVVKAIQDAATELKPGETFLFTFSGHGSREPSDNFIEPDGRDETIVLSDHLLLDSFWVNDLWPRFDSGVRAIVVADSCHAGGAFTLLDKLILSLISMKNFIMTRVAEMVGLRGVEPAARVPRVVRQLDEQEKKKEFKKFKDFYDMQAAVTAPPQGIRASRVILSACRAREDAVELDGHGAFTQALLDIWNQGAFPGPEGVFADNYIGFIDAIKNEFNDPNQHPELSQEGQPDFTSQRPFSI